jgi:Leucine-rich repeat (LRR) protein
MRLYYFLFLVFNAMILHAQDVTIPNPNFKAKLLAASASNTIARNLNNAYFKIDANNDGAIQVSEAQQVSWLDLSSSNILNVQGIEAFTSLSYLDCTSNFIADLNIGALTLLEELRCGGNELDELDLSANTTLKVLLCEGNHLTGLDVSMLVDLEVLNCSTNELAVLTLGELDNLIYLTCNVNQLTSLDASSFESLKNIECSHNSLTSLNVSGSAQVEDLRCNSNNLTSIDVTTLANLNLLDVSVNDLTEIDLSNQQLLEVFWCIYNEFTTLDMTACMFLDQLDIRFNEDLVSLYIKNGSNETLTLAVNLNLALVCCDEDEVTYVQNLGGLPATAVVTSTACQLSTQDVALHKGISYPNPATDFLYFNPSSGIEKIEIYDLSGRMLLTRTTAENQVGLSGFTAGTYVVKLHSNKRIFTEKMIVRN